MVANSDLNVLILGETGVGKELIAKAIHQGSPRAERPLVYLNCAALPESRITSYNVCYTKLLRVLSSRLIYLRGDWGHSSLFS